MASFFNAELKQISQALQFLFHFQTFKHKRKPSFFDIKIMRCKDMILTVIVATFKTNREILVLAFLFEQFDEIDVFMDELLFF